jgi:hypothetical protein
MTATENVIVPDLAETLPDADNSPLAKLIQWWGETQAILTELAVTARAIARHARTDGDPLYLQIIPNYLIDFAMRLEDDATNLSNNPPMPGRALFDPLADLPEPDPEKLRAADLVDLAGREVAKWTDAEHARWTRERQLALTEHAPSVEAAASNALKAMFSGVIQFAREFYPAATFATIMLSFEDRGQHVSLPLSLKRD